jgi:hypothetical protein
MELINASSRVPASCYLSCKKRAVASVQFAGNEDCFFIRIAIKSDPAFV